MELGLAELVVILALEGTGPLMTVDCDKPALVTLLEPNPLEVVICVLGDSEDVEPPKLD